jgi:GntR family transcriptional repressor for pyruvate dehydrogenase complex
MVRAALDELNAASDAGEEPDRLCRLDAAFHLTITAAADNRSLRQTSNVLHDMILADMETTLLIPGRIEIAHRDHERIYVALAGHDPAAARRASRAHIRGAHLAASRRLAAASDPV